MIINKSTEKLEYGSMDHETPIPRNSLGLYLHIPFCIQKCSYCDFLSFGESKREDHSVYINTLLKEMSWFSPIYHNQFYVDTVFIGGGTPSILENALISDLLNGAKSCFDLDRDAEISIECNPKTLTEEKLNTYLELGINRLSIGVQSFHDPLLKTLGRVHTTDDFYKNYRMARECGFQNINIDLMFSIPGQTMETWKKTLDEVMELNPEHLSFYSLQIEENTPFYAKYMDGTLIPVDDGLDREMYHHALDTIQRNGYEHYEISNASRKGYRCRHNLKYWSMENYLGLGLGAHSFMDGTRFSNEKDFKEYIKKGMHKNRWEKSNPIMPFAVWKHVNSNEDTISEYLFTGLRKIEGIDLTDFRKRFGKPVEEIFASNWHRLQKFIEDGYLVKTAENMRFSLKGIDISNTILMEFV